MNGGGPVICARVAEACNRVSGQGLAAAEERVHSGLAREAKEGESEAWEQFKAFTPLTMGAGC